MKLQRAAFTVTLLLLIVPLAAQAQPTARLPRIGVLSVAPPTAADGPGFNALREALRELGYVEGKSIALELRLAGGYERSVSPTEAAARSLGLAGGWRSGTRPRATGDVPLRHQSEDRQGARPHHPPLVAGAGNEDHRVKPKMRWRTRGTSNS